MTLTKTLKFAPNVLDILRQSTWSADGLSVVMPQMDRPLYVAVNKALAACGGVWNRKVAAHQFKLDPRPLIDGLLASGTLEVERDGFFETPNPVACEMHALLPLPMRRGGKVLEPSAGLGAILLVLLRQPFAQWTQFALCEKNAARLAQLQTDFPTVKVAGANFLELYEGGYDRIYMNPPFEEGQDMAHVRHAYGLLAPGGGLVSVMSAGHIFRSDRQATQFRDWSHNVGGESYMLPAGSFRASGTDVNTCLFVVRKTQLRPEQMRGQMSLFEETTR